MSENKDESQVLQNFCIECKSDLSKESHLKNCKSVLKHEDEKIPEIQNPQIKKDIEEIKRKREIEDARIEAETKEKIAKEKIIRDKQIETALKIKDKLIEQILVRDSKANVNSLKKMSLDDLKTFYTSLTETIDTVNRKISKIKVTCPKCRKYLGITTSLKEIQSMQKEHKKECEKIPKGTSTALKLILGLAILGLAFGAMFAMQNPHLFKKKPCSDCDGDRND